MKAVVFHKPKDVRVEEWDDPTIQDARDAIIRVTSTCICGSDLHIYNGLLPQLKKMVLGHEFMGVVEEVGEGVSDLKSGDRVVVPFPVADGTCWFCQHGMPTHCENSNRMYGPEGGVLKGKGAGLFGYTDLYGGHDGGQAERVRVPFADHGPRKIPSTLKDEQAVLLTDVLPTAWWANEWADVKPGSSVAIFGAGPVGAMSARIASLRGADRVIVVDPQDYRLALVRRLTGATTVNPDEEDPVEFIRGLTDGRGADCTIDAVGMEADRSIVEKAANLVHLQRGSMKVLSRCFDAVRRGGSVGVVGIYGTPMDNFPLSQLVDKGLKVQGGQAYVHEIIDRLLADVVAGKLRGDDLFTHTFALEEAPYAYSIFNKKEEGCVKVLLKP
ncbi:MAG TPA: alcohol dehydrogenase catalytic domain-containing protein [Candidatus Thermoplasmatota archaeon]|nr:alcohol dehydrogenase catalytic domain-containing protein [Candidatus Thermoplasmatota archaeon]